MIGGREMTLDQLVTQLRAAHGDALLGILVYGSTAHDPAAKKGHNIAVVVRALDMAAMHADGAIARSWYEAGNPVPLVMTEAEWRSSVDVFAIEHADIADRHRVLFSSTGFAVTSRAAVKVSDIRRQLEYELLAQLLAVRAAIAAAGNDADPQREILSVQAGRAVAMMRATLRLSGHPVPDGGEGVCAAAAELAGFDAAPFLAALRQRHGEAKVAKGELGATLDAFHAGLSRLVAFVDALPTPARG
jgi:hypothetical protein